MYWSKILVQRNSHMASGTPHLTRRQDIFYFRMSVPQDLAKAIGRTELKRSLCTSNCQIARIRCSWLSCQFETLFMSLRRMSHHNPEIVQNIVRSYFEEGLNQVAELALILPDDPMKDLNAEILGLEAERKVLQKKIGAREYSEQVRALAKDLLNKRDKALPGLDAEAFNILCSGLLRADAEQRRILAMALSGQYDQTMVKDPLFEGANLPHAPLLPGEEPVKAESLTLGEAVERYFEAKISMDAWQSKTLNDQKRVHGWFSDSVGVDLPICDVTKETVRDFRNSLMKLPSNFVKSPQFKHMSFIEAAKQEGDFKRISSKTAKKYFEMLKSFLKWCESESYIDSAPIGVAGIKVKENPQDARRPFTQKELQFIFNSPLFTGHKDNKHRAVSGERITRDGKYWIPLIGLYSGMRLGEIVQLLVMDIKEEDGVSYFDVTKDDGDGKKIKTTAGYRKIPVHPMLKEIGLMDYVAKIRAKNSDGRLFPDIAFAANGYPSGNFTKFFSRYLNKIGAKTPKTAFHSLRHNFTDALEIAAIPENRMKQLLGHSEKSVTSIYLTSFKLDLLSQDIEKLRYPIEIGGIKG